LESFHDLFLQYDAEDQFDTDELVIRLRDMRESVRKRYELGNTLDEQLAEAVKSENYELAAQLRDQMQVIEPTRPLGD
jgi:excinuclease UvrABC helicase subunit UvrB